MTDPEWPVGDAPGAAGWPAGGQGPDPHERRLLGIKLHNLIFLGLFLGVLLGLGVWSLDHQDRLVLVDGTELAGRLQVAGDTYSLLLPDGTEVRELARDVSEARWARETTSGRLYGAVVWWLNFFGTTIFMGLLKMIIAPLILSSIVAGIVSLPGLSQLRRIGLRTITYYLVTTSVAVAIGLLAVNLVSPGTRAASQQIRQQRQGVLKTRELAYTEETHLPARSDDGTANRPFLSWLSEREAREAGTGQEADRFRRISGAQGTGVGDLVKESILRPMLTNPFASLTHATSLGIIFFALLLGVAVVSVGAPAKPVAEVFIGFSEVITRITHWLMSLAPFCVMCIVAELVANQGPQVFATLAWYCITVIGGIALHVAFLVAVATSLGGTSPARLWQGISEAWLIAFTTRSSAATLPVTLRCVTGNLGVSPRVANFALPVGATMNMDGTALYEGVAVLFLLQIYGGLLDVPIPLTAGILLVVFITAVLASVGAAAVPDAGLVTMVLVAEAVGLPVYYIPLIFAVDAFLDMFRTSTNVLGDVVGCLVVQRLEDRSPTPLPV